MKSWRRTAVGGRHGRLWTASEFKKYLGDITAGVEILADVDLGLQLPHEGGLVRQDIQQYAYMPTH
ncbi:hypothetical protein AL036_22270 [Salipiger aestuarii]|uniref:hypothetical protein n=1 Tax=Salipiger aestuarii TaxID=568098 RepID=UPI00123A160D|nr:hypothetical protein [Salipiger aestuarii]KAA8603509.1 hypothetical protein AL036_22270 [Salipiger aestuarii]